MVHCAEGICIQYVNCEARDRLDGRYDCIVRPVSFIVDTTYQQSNRGSWKTSSFKRYNFEAEGIPVGGGALHPLMKVREEIRNIFLEMG